MKARNSPAFAKTALILCGLLLWTAACAQPRYSVNAIAYADVACAVGSNLIANPFNAGDNSISNLFRGVPEGTLLQLWNSATQEFGPTNRFSEVTGWTDSGVVLATPDAGFLWLPVARQISFVGEVWQARDCVTFPAGTTVVSLFPEYACGFCEGFTDPCPAMIPDGTTMWTWNRALQLWNWPPYTYLAGTGWLRDLEPSALPQLAPGEGARFWAPQAFTARAAGSGGLPRSHAMVRLREGACAGTNLMFHFAATNAVAWAVLRSTNLISETWEVLREGTTTPTGTVARISVPAGTNEMAFYRLIPPLVSPNAILVDASRAGSQFTFHFYAPMAGTYEVQRTLRNPADPTGWQAIRTIAASANTLVRVTDANATAASGYYRLRH